jgi:predicted CoA-substrate-specific enzyme activase
MKKNRVLFWRYQGIDKTREAYLEPADSVYEGPVVVLVDHLSVSSAEEFSGGLKAIKRATIVGERTPGVVDVGRAATGLTSFGFFAISNNSGQQSISFSFLKFDCYKSPANFGRLSMSLSNRPHILGVDIGSVSIDVVAIDARHDIVQTAYEFHHGKPEQKLKEILEQFNLKSVGRIAATGGTPSVLKAARRYDNRVAVMRAVGRYHEKVGSILVVGGEKFGLIRLDDSGNYLNFKSNTGCAAGTGSFLDQQAQRLNLSGAAELSRMACSNNGPVPKIASRCAVFAKTDLVHAQQEGYSLAQICDGLCRGLAHNIFATLFTSDNFHGPIVFTGGVSLNRAVVNHLQVLTGKRIITAETLFYSAIGAALSLADDTAAPPFRGIRSSDDILQARGNRLEYFHDPLELALTDYPDFNGIVSYGFRDRDANDLLEVEVDIYQDLTDLGPLKVHLGVDVGSTSTKAVVLDRQKAVAAGFYTRTAGNPLTAVQRILAAVHDMAHRYGLKLNFVGVATTGAGRKFIGNIIGADLVIDEITTHARAAVEIDPRVDTIIEIGGQDAKFTTLHNGRVTFAAMNTVCAAGTGSFIEEQAQKLNCPLSQYSARASRRRSPMASDRCTVFMERDLNHHLTAGYAVDEVLAAVLHSVRENYLTKVAIENRIGDVISFQGATAKNKALVAAFEKRLDKSIMVSRYCHLTGALGAALMLFDQPTGATRFRGLDLCQKDIPLRHETCDLCTNHCKLTVAEIEGTIEAYGFMCGRDYDIRHYVNNNRSGFDLLKMRARTFSFEQFTKNRETFTIGIPAALHLLEDLPFWQYFFHILGIKTITDKVPDKDSADGKRLAGAEFCAPMTALHSQVGDLLGRSDFIFLPFYLDKKGREKGPRRQYCYYTQFAPSLNTLAGGRQMDTKFLTPVVHYLYSSFHTKAQLYRMLKSICRHRISYFDVSSAFDRASEFRTLCRSRWRTLYQQHAGDGTDLHVMLLGRPYNVMAADRHKGIPDILAALGIKAFFQDMLSYTEQDVESIAALLKEVHWHFGAKVLEAAEVVANTPGAYPILMTAFKCSPDSFVIDYFQKIMASHDKPYLILQLDDHDTSGGYETRIEAAVRSFQNHHSMACRRGTKRPLSLPLAAKSRHLLNRTLVLPNWDSIVCKLLTANLVRAGFDARCLKETPAVIRRSMRFNSGQCTPLNIIAQEFIDFVETRGLDPDQTVLWMPAGEIACNIKLYPHYIKNILHSYGNGMQQAEVYPGQLSMLDISVMLPVNNYFAYMFGGIIRKIGCRFRPYERHNGSTDQMIERAIDILHDAFLGGRAKQDAVAEVVAGFEAIELNHRSALPQRPKVAVFGDLYARDNDVMNQNLVYFIEEHGGEVITTPYSEYLKLVSRPYLRKWLIEGHYLSAISSKALMASLKKKEKMYYTQFKRVLKEPKPEYSEPVGDILARYHVRLENTGESMDNLLKIHYIKKHHPDVALFVQTSPAFCCPALVTEAMANEIERQTGTPVVSITYDSTGGNQNDAIIPYLKFPRNTGRQQDREAHQRLGRP